MSHMGNLKLNQPANSIFSGDDKNKALNNIKFREKKILKDTDPEKEVILLLLLAF